MPMHIMTKSKNTRANIFLLLGLLFRSTTLVHSDASIEFYPGSLLSFAPEGALEAKDPNTTGITCGGGICLGSFQLDLSTPGVLTTKLTVPQGLEIKLTPPFKPEGIVAEINFFALNAAADSNNCQNSQTFLGPAIATDIKGSSINGLEPFVPYVSMNSCFLQMNIGFDGPDQEYSIQELLWNVTYNATVAGLQTYDYGSDLTSMLAWNGTDNWSVSSTTATPTAEPTLSAVPTSAPTHVPTFAPTQTPTSGAESTAIASLSLVAGFCVSLVISLIDSY